jgi:flagellar biosynthesis GTPase FlhF
MGLSSAFKERDAAKKTLAAVAATLKLSSADLVTLGSAAGNGELKALLSGRSITEVAVTTATSFHNMNRENLQIKEQLDDLREELASKEKERKAAVAASLITPPQSPVLVKSKLNGASQKVEEDLAKAKKETEREQERVRELEKRLAAFEAADIGERSLKSTRQRFLKADLSLFTHRTLPFENELSRFGVGDDQLLECGLPRH